MSQPKKLLLNTEVDGDVAGPCLAVVRLTDDTIAFLLQQFDLFKKTRKRDHGTYQLTRFDYTPTFLERRGIATDLEKFEEEAIDALFESAYAQQAANNGWALLPEHYATPAWGMRLDYSILEVSAATEVIYLRWRGCIKHTTWEVTTADLTEDDILKIRDEAALPRGPACNEVD